MPSNGVATLQTSGVSDLPWPHHRHGPTHLLLPRTKTMLLMALKKPPSCVECQVIPLVKWQQLVDHFTCSYIKVVSNDGQAIAILYREYSIWV